MSYAVLNIDKIKDRGTMKSRWIHNERRTDIIGHDIPNADSEKSKNNVELIGLPTDRNGNQMSYDQVWNKRLAELDYYQNHKIRKNAVLAYDVVLGYSKDESIDATQWAKLSVEWLKQTFNKAGDGRENVLHAVMHMDEANPHIHALVIPVDERNHLNAHAYTDGRKAMRALQTSYAKSVSSLGIERGVKGSTAKHQNIHMMYAKLDKAMQVPEVQKGETAEQYRARVIEDIQTQKAVNHREAEELKIELRRKSDRNRSVQTQELQTVFTRSQARLRQQKEEQKDEIERQWHLLDEHTDKQNDRLDQREAELDAQAEELDELRAQLAEMRQQLESQREAIAEDEDDAREYRKIKLAMAYAKEHYYSYYQETSDSLEWLSEIGQGIMDGTYELEHSHGLDADGRDIPQRELDNDEPSL